MKICILDVYRRSIYRISKDTCGGYGTENNFGIGIVPNLLSRVTKYSLFWPPLSSLNLYSEFFANGDEVSYTNNIKDINDSYDFIFIQVSIVCSDYELKIAKKIKEEFPKLKIFAFGSFIDIVKNYYHELGISTFTGQLEFLFQNIKVNYSNLNLLHLNRDNSVISSNPDNLALPLWIKDKSCQTKNLLFKSANYIPIIATRGCPYSCYEYCVYPLQQGRNINSSSPEKVIEDIKFVNKNIGKTHFVFRDPVFTINKKYSFELLKLLSNYNKSNNNSFTIETHLNNINEELSYMLVEAKIEWVKVGIESSSDDVKSNVSRYSLTNDENSLKINLLNSKKIKSVAMYILCQPEDNYETIENTINYSLRLKTNLAQFSLFTPYPGTPFFIKNQHMLLHKNYEKFNQYELVYKHKIFDNKTARKLLGKAYTKYYLNKLWKI